MIHHRISRERFNGGASAARKLLVTRPLMGIKVLPGRANSEKLPIVIHRPPSLPPSLPRGRAQSHPPAARGGRLSILTIFARSATRPLSMPVAETSLCARRLLPLSLPLLLPLTLSGLCKAATHRRHEDDPRPPCLDSHVAHVVNRPRFRFHVRNGKLFSRRGEGSRGKLRRS